MIKKLAVAAKAIVAFVLPLVTNMVVDLVQGTAPWPQTGPEWARWVLLSVTAAIGVYGVPNKATPKQVTKAAEDLPPDVLADALKSAAPAVQDNIEAAHEEAQQIIDDVNDVDLPDHLELDTGLAEELLKDSP